MDLEVQDAYKEALRFAAEKHKSQKEKGTDLPYLVHLTSVAAEIMVAGIRDPTVDLRFALVVALLHDVLEDTETTVDELTLTFGTQVSSAVSALTKSKEIADKEARLMDSLERIQLQPKEVWMVKMADRVTNLAAPALPWPEEKRKKYMEGSNLILAALQQSDECLAKRLKVKIKEYVDYVVAGT